MTHSIDCAEAYIDHSRRAESPVEPVFLERWSPRAYDATPVPIADLTTILEAARWAPSAYNVQPWRFSYAIRGDDYWSDFLALLDPFNQAWARNAGALVFLISDSLTLPPDTDNHQVSRTHSFDAGAAWAQFALQASMSGYQAHAMAGIYFGVAAEYFALPRRYRVEIAIAVGREASATTLPSALEAQEVPSSRHSLRDIAAAGRFPALQPDPDDYPDLSATIA